MKRIMIDPSKCDGCKSCALACMDSHRTDGKTGVETLDFSDPSNESRNEIVNDGSGDISPCSAATAVPRNVWKAV